jgi:hypothetical protein
VEYPISLEHLTNPVGSYNHALEKLREGKSVVLADEKGRLYEARKEGDELKLQPLKISWQGVERSLSGVRKDLMEQVKRRGEGYMTVGKGNGGRYLEVNTVDNGIYLRIPIDGGGCDGGYEL